MSFKCMIGLHDFKLTAIDSEFLPIEVIEISRDSYDYLTCKCGTKRLQSRFGEPMVYWQWR